jgi:hypothetical protein
VKSFIGKNKEIQSRTYSWVSENKFITIYIGNYELIGKTLNKKENPNNFFVSYLERYPSTLIETKGGKINPMMLTSIKEIKYIGPPKGDEITNIYDLNSHFYRINFGVDIKIENVFGHGLGRYYKDQWIRDYSLCRNIENGPLWVSGGLYNARNEKKETDIILIDGNDNERKIYLPASNHCGGYKYWIAEDGSSYCADIFDTKYFNDSLLMRKTLLPEEALIPKYLVRKAPLPREQKNPEKKEIIECDIQKRNDTIKIKGQLINQMTNEPINGAKLYSIMEFLPENVTTDENGNFEFTIISEFEGNYVFINTCDGGREKFRLEKDYVIMEGDDIKEFYETALIIEKFDSEEIIMDISDAKNQVDIGKLYLWPKTELKITTDIPVKFDIFTKYRNIYKEYNGVAAGFGNNMFKTQHFAGGLPLDYEFFVRFTDETGKEFKTDFYKVPKDVACHRIDLNYSNGKAKWNVTEQKYMEMPSKFELSPKKPKRGDKEQSIPKIPNETLCENECNI